MHPATLDETLSTLGQKYIRYKIRRTLHWRRPAAYLAELHRQRQRCGEATTELGSIVEPHWATRKINVR